MFERLLSKVCPSLESPFAVPGKTEHSCPPLFLQRAHFIFRKIVLPSLAAILLTNSSTSAQTVRSEATMLADAKSFMASYAEDLQAAKRDAIVNRYDARGFYRLGEGRKAFVSYEELKKQYMERWRPPVAMAWRDLSYEVIGTEGVLVMGLLDWETSPENKTTFSYTGMLTYQDGVLKLRLEDESRRIPPPVVTKTETGASK